MYGQTLRHRQQGSYQIWKHEGKDRDVEEALNQCFPVITGQGVHVSRPVLESKSEELLKSWVITI